MNKGNRSLLLALSGLLPLVAAASADSYLKGPPTPVAEATFTSCPAGSQQFGVTTGLFFCIYPEYGAFSQIGWGGNTLSSGREGYAICGASFEPKYAVNLKGSVGFNPAVVTQPNGVNTFPLTITKTAADGTLQLTQSYVLDKDPAKLVAVKVTVTMEVRNLSTNRLTGIQVARAADFDMGASFTDDDFAATNRSAFGWDENGAMLMLSGFITQVPAQASVGAYAGFPFTDCSSPATAAPTLGVDGSAKVVYDIGTLYPAGSLSSSGKPNDRKSVAFTYEYR